MNTASVTELQLTMEETRVPRYRGAVKASLGMLAVLLLCQASFPFTRIQQERLNGVEERRLSWLGFGGAVKGGVDEKKAGVGTAAARKPVEEEAAAAAVAEATAVTAQKAMGGKMPRSKRGGTRGNNVMKAASAKLASVSVSDTVDLDADRDGVLWLPTSMTPPQCGGSEEADGCESTVRFCLIEIDEYQESPWKYPMAAMLQKRSKCHAAENIRAFRLSALRVYMREHPGEFLQQPNGFVFHETRTGSSLVANMLAHVPENLVISENNVAEDPVRHCEHCTDEQKVSLLKDIMKLFGRGLSRHKHLFFKFQDATTLKLISRAFPDVGWVYLFRDPVEVMVSNLKGAYGKRKRFYEGIDFDAANNTSPVVQGRSKPMRPMMSPCLLSGGRSKSASKEEVCANRLKSLCQAAVDQLEEQPQSAGGKGAVVEYTGLPEALTDFIYPSLFGMGDEKLREHLPFLSDAAKMYSKSMSNPESEFAQGTDKGYKRAMAEKAYKDAAEATGLSAVYRKLQGLQTWHKKEERLRL